MKIINLKTKVVFDLPKSDAEQLLSASPDLFEKVTGKTKKRKKEVHQDANQDDNSVLSKILDD